MTPTLTTTQLQALKAAIIADPALNAEPNNSDGALAIAQALNLLASPTFWVWRTNVPTADCKKAMVWTEYIARSVGERDAWQFMLSNGFINAADTNIRQGIQDIFSGPGGLTTRTNLTTIASRGASRAEKILANTAGGSGATQTPGATGPATMTAEGLLNFQEVQAARAS